MTVFFDLDRTLMNFEVGEDLGIKAVFENYKNELKMDYEEFRSTWKDVAQKIFDEYSAGLHTFDEQRHLRVKKMFELNGVVLDENEVEKRFKLYWSNYEKESAFSPMHVTFWKILGCIKSRRDSFQTVTLPTSAGNSTEKNSRTILIR